jgi:hypothetical protein
VSIHWISRLALLGCPYTGSVPNPAPVAPNTWTCARCEMTVSFRSDVEDTSLPSSWTEKDGVLYCLSCRREMAGDASLEGVEEGVPSQERQKIRSRARIEFEIRRDPARADNEIAKACRTSTFSVRKARDRMGMNRPDSI